MGSILAAAMDYASRGWKLCAVYPVLDGVCACDRGANCKTPGKHPRGSGWQRSPRPPTYWQRSRDNVGILTGRASGFWVLDYDPAAADVAGADLETLLTGYGLTPQVRTGSGGLHWRFRVPVGRTIANGQNGVGALPAGFDVRGEGGMVVAPPSVSGKGPYVELDTGVCDAPDWLYALMGERRDPASRMDVPSRENPPFEVQGTPARPAGNPRPGAWEYYYPSLLEECATYAALDDYRRGTPMASFARSLVELWRGAVHYGLVWTEDWVYGHFRAAVEQATSNRPDGGYDVREIPGQWRSAVAHVERTGGWRDMGPEAEVLPPFRPAPGSGASANGGSGTADSYVPTFTNPGQPVSAPAVSELPPVPVDLATAQFDEAVRIGKVRARIRREVDRQVAEEDAAGRRPLVLDLVSADQLDEIPDPVPLVDGWLFVDSLARINGKPGQGKSFVAIDLAAHVAAGRAWHGHAVRQGPVLYMAAEGLSGVKLRVRAWESATGVKLGADFMLLRRAVQVADPEWEQFVQLVRERRPALVVLDTQARITVGLNENSNSELGQLVLAADALREATGACVLLIHHKGKGDQDGGRGGNAVEGAMTSEFDVWKRGHQVSMKTTRQKDIEADAKAEFMLTESERSAVLVRKIEFLDPTGVPVEDWKAQARALYGILRSHSGAAGISEAEAKKAAVAMSIFSDGKAPKTAANLAGYAWNNLIMRGLVIRKTETKKFGVHVMANVGPDGVLTPNAGEWEVADPTGWETYAPDAVDPDADWSINLGKTGGTRVSAAIGKMGSGK